MLKLSRLADYSVVVLLRLAAGAGVQTASGLSGLTGIPEPTVAKVLKLLAAGGLVTSSRGARGGYRVARTVREISVAQVIVAIDGPIALTACVEGAPVACEVSRICAVHGRWAAVNDAVREALDAISLADLHHPPAIPAPLPGPLSGTLAGSLAPPAPAAEPNADQTLHAD